MPEFEIDKIPVVFWLEDGGLTMGWEFEFESRGRVTGKITWPTVELAADNYESAKQGVLDRLPRYLEQLESQGQGTSQQDMKRFAGGFLYWSTGVPTWWAPRLTLQRSPLRVGGGWLRLSVFYTREDVKL